MNELHYTPAKQAYLRGKTLFITGASRGIGRAIALRAARDGANIAIVAKTIKPHPKIPGTIFTVAEEVRKVGGKALPIACDIRDEASVEAAIQKTVAEFGGIDIVVNNASAISLTDTLSTSLKSYDLMHTINVRGTFAVSKAAIPYLLKAPNPHILTLSPPISLKPQWFGGHVPYTMSKYGMSMVTMGLAEEFKSIAVNSLWPQTVIETSALQAFAGDRLNELRLCSRTAAIVADSAYAIFCQSASTFSNVFAIDEAVMKAQNVRDLSIYNSDPNRKDLIPDLFIEHTEYSVPPMTVVLAAGTKSKL